MSRPKPPLLPELKLLDIPRDPLLPRDGLDWTLLWGMVVLVAAVYGGAFVGVLYSLATGGEWP